MPGWLNEQYIRGERDSSALGKTPRQPNGWDAQPQEAQPSQRFSSHPNRATVASVRTGDEYEYESTVTSRFLDLKHENVKGCREIAIFFSIYKWSKDGPWPSLLNYLVTSTQEDLQTGQWDM